MKKTLLPALAAVCLASCTGTTASNNDAIKKETAAYEEEKIFVIPPLKDTSSIHNHLRPLTPHSIVYPKSLLHDTLSRELSSDITLTYTSDTMKLHVKGDYCWIEYVSAGTSRVKRKDGTIQEDITGSNENSDTLKIK